MKAIKLALLWQMGIALILGARLGIIFCDSYSAWGNVINGIGDIFLHAINMIVIPLVFLSTVLGISTMTDSKSMGRIADCYGWNSFTNNGWTDGEGVAH